MTMPLRSMLVGMPLLFALLATLPVLAAQQNAHAMTGDCEQGTHLEHTFSSGASWSLCAQVDNAHGLDVSLVHYRAPGDSSRSVLHHAHVGQILLHYHDETEARVQIGAAQKTPQDAPQETLLESGRLLAMTDNNCDGAQVLADNEAARLCSRIEDNRTLAKYAQRPSLQSQRWELISGLRRDGLVWAISMSFTEDGQITPAVTLSGRARESNTTDTHAATLPTSARRLARATVLATWRMVFNLDDGGFDTVQQFDFPLDVSLGNRRPMQVTELATEAFATVNRDRFRGWRIADPTGTGYYLDPSNSGFSFTGSRHNWARFDVGLTRFKPCERYALGNTNDSCGASLDDHVSGESMEGAHPVMWFSQSRTFNPTDEHWPVISNFHQSFTLLPYDWTAASPFEVLE